MSEVYDLESLQNEVRYLQKQKRQLMKEQVEAEGRISDLEAKCGSVRSEFNVAGAVDMVRFFVADTATSGGTEGSISGSQSVKPITDQKFIEANKKLEIKILNADMNAVLPALEKDALALERKLATLNDVMSQAERQEAGIPMYMMKTTDELRKEADDAMDRRVLVKASMKQDINERLSKKVALKAEISRLRQKLALVADEEWAIKNGVYKMRMALAASDGTSSVLSSRHRELRQALFPNAADAPDGSEGWAGHAFEKMCVVVDGLAVVAFRDIPSVILPWIASFPQMVMELGGPRGKINLEVAENFDPSMLGQSLEESHESAASRGAENLIMRFLQTQKVEEVHAKGLSKGMFVNFCDWLESENDSG